MDTVQSEIYSQVGRCLLYRILHPEIVNRLSGEDEVVRQRGEMKIDFFPFNIFVCYFKESGARDVRCDGE